MAQSGRVHSGVGGCQAATGSLTEHREHAVWTKSRSVTSDTSLWHRCSQLDADRIFFFLNLARALGFTHSGGCESQTALPPHTESSCQDCLGILDRTRMGFLLVPLWSVTFSGVESVGATSFESATQLHIQIPELGRDKGVTMMKQCHHFPSSSLYRVTHVLSLTCLLLALTSNESFLFHRCLEAQPGTRSELTKKDSKSK